MLCKCTSNSSNLLAHLPESYLEINSLSLDLETDTTVKIVGLQWLRSLDVFSYRINLTDKPLRNAPCFLISLACLALLGLSL